MEFRTISTKIPSNELTLFKRHCEKKGMTPSNLIRDLILEELKITVPNTVSGRNRINYERDLDTFAWSIVLDSGKRINVLQHISPYFIDDIREQLSLALNERSVFIKKTKNNSVPIPSQMTRK